MADFGDFLKNYRHRIDEEGEPSNDVGASIAQPEAGGYKRVMKGNHPHYTVPDNIYRNIRKGKKKYSRWDRFISDAPELCGAVRECMGKYGSVTVESSVSGQSVRLRK